MIRKYKVRDSDFLTDKQILRQLHGMEKSDIFKTSSCYSTDTETYPDNVMTFAEKHLTYLQKNPQVNPQQYLDNLRLMVRQY